MPVFRLDPKELTFPAPYLAERGGLLAIGGDLSPERLILAYQNGIFPWFEDEGVFYWYSPDPRCVVFPDELKVHKSMNSIFNQHKFRYSLDTQFETVMRNCSGTPREGQDGSWITDAFIRGYNQLHEMGIAHSVEVWEEERLVGGLYGISLGKIFYGESMFSHVPNASKAGFIHFARALKNTGYRLIDCQQETNHLLSLGARSISRELFLEYLLQNYYERTLAGKWSFGEGHTIVCTPSVALHGTT
jgi:leucyl/phenylalanyl-tRNA--protein transferase